MPRALCGIGTVALAAGVMHATPRAAVARAQLADEWRVASGRVLVASGSARKPAGGRWVTLHRVGRDSSGPMDSVRTAADGAFAIRYRPFGDTSALYFGATLYGGVAYYAIPEHGGGARAGAVNADIIVYDTTSARDALRVESRHIVVSAPERPGVREVTEVLVLFNAGSSTVVAPPGGASLEVALPDGAAGARAAEGDVSPDAMSFGGGAVRVTAPISPGSRRLSYAYHLSAAATIRPGSGSAGLLEILVEDSAALVRGAGVKELAPVPVSGRLYRRFTASDVADVGAFEIVAPTGGRRGASLSMWLAGIAALVMAAGFVAAIRRRPPLATSLDGT